MKVTYRGARRVIEALGRLFAHNDESANAVCQLEWAYAALQRPNETFPNGKTLHECANETVEKFEDVALEHRLFTAGA